MQGWQKRSPCHLANVTLPEFKVLFWSGLLALAKVHPEILEKLNDAVRQSVATETLKEALKKTGEPPNYRPIK
jgi:tripartite-type tricarboxylate transporter receptor subunit TctC